jgi:hypothetical protein
MAIPTFTPPVPGTTVAQLTVDGLGICVFNDGSSNGGVKFWEVAYLRRMRHNLVITIAELDAQGEPIAGKVVPYPVDESVESFRISLTSGSEAHYGVYPQGGPADPNFVRTATNNSPHDLGWIIDVTAQEAQHDFNRLVPKSESGVNATLAEFRHSFFYTRKPGAHPVRLAPLTDNDPNSAASIELGQSNEELDGLLLASAPGEITFEFEPARCFSINPLSYDLNGHCRYRISIINEDEQFSQPKGGFVRGDFHFYYDVMEVNGEKQDLWARPRPTTPGSPADGDCNVGRAGGLSSLRALIS